MRCSFLSLLPLFVAFISIVTDTCLGSPTNHDQHKRINDGAAQLLDAFRFHPATSLAASEGANRDLPRERDIPISSRNPSAVMIHRHNHIVNQLQLHSGSSSLDKRSLSLVADLTILGFKLIWDHADVIVSSSLAYYRTTEYYKNMTILAGGEFSFGPTVQNYVITYGVFRLTFSILAEEIAKAFPNGFGEFIQGFAEMMLVLTAGVVIGTYTLLAFSVTLSIWITMVIVENAKWPDLVSGP